MSHADYLAHEAKFLPKEESSHGVELESDLHGEIMQYCREHGWLAFHGSMAHKAMRTPGEPDFVILCPNCTLLIECKTRTGKLTPEQLSVHAHAEKLGHCVYLVRSMDDFRSVLRDLDLEK
jgi:Holliday junction resolvase